MGDDMPATVGNGPASAEPSAPPAVPEVEVVPESTPSESSDSELPELAQPDDDDSDDYEDDDDDDELTPGDDDDDDELTFGDDDDDDDDDGDMWSDSWQPADHLDAMMEELDCPFTWCSRPMTGPEIRQLTLYDKGGLATPWNELVSRVWLAFTYAEQQCPELSKAPIAEAYLRLMPEFNGGDELVAAYGPALRHLVDATWAHVGRKLCKEGDEDAVRELTSFVEAIERSDEMGNEQQSAFCALRAEMESVPENLKSISEAIEMLPSEGYWHCIMARLTGASRRLTMTGRDGNDIWLFVEVHEKTAAMEAFAKKKNVETYTVYANILIELGDFSKAVEVLKEGVEAFPDSAWMLCDAAESMRTMPKPHRDMRMAVRYYERALACPGGRGDTPYVRYHLAATLLERGDLKEALPHLEAAAAVLPEARTLLATAKFVRKDGLSSVNGMRRVQAASAAFSAGKGGHSYFGMSGPGYFPTHSGRIRL